MNIKQPYLRPGVFGKCKNEASETRSPSGGAYRKVICTKFKMTASGHHCIYSFPSFTGFTFVALDGTIAISTDLLKQPRKTSLYLMNKILSFLLE